MDIDEFIITRRHPGGTIREELQSTFKEADCVKAPWVMMSANGRQRNPDSLLLETTYRWGHDRWHENRVSDHNPYGARGDVVCVDGVENAPAPLGPMHENLREADIARALLICCHYRIFSAESAREKMQSNMFCGTFTLGDVMSVDHPERVDGTLARKTRSRREYPPSSVTLRSSLRSHQKDMCTPDAADHSSGCSSETRSPQFDHRPRV